MRNKISKIIAMMTAIVISAVIIVAVGKIGLEEATEGPAFGKDIPSVASSRANPS